MVLGALRRGSSTGAILQRVRLEIEMEIKIYGIRVIDHVQDALVYGSHSVAASRAKYSRNITSAFLSSFPRLVR